MAKQTLGPDTIQQLIDLRDHHVAEAKRCDDALALLGQVSKIAKRAHAVTGKAQQRATAEKGAPAPKRQYHKQSKRAAAAAADRARHKAARETGQRPKDFIRAAFAKSGTRPLTVETLREAVAESGMTGAAANRATGVVLGQLVAEREIRRLRGGEYVKHRLTTANDNGAHA